eukprot:RCo039813
MDAIEVLMKTNFCAAANGVTRLYMDGVRATRKAHRLGKQEALEELHQFLMDEAKKGAAHIRLDQLLAHLWTSAQKLKSEAAAENASGPAGASSEDGARVSGESSPALSATSPVHAQLNERKRALEDPDTEMDSDPVKRPRTFLTHQPFLSSAPPCSAFSSLSLVFNSAPTPSTSPLEFPVGLGPPPPPSEERRVGKERKIRGAPNP